jgi:O-glycosyl hydrolase
MTDLIVRIGERLESAGFTGIEFMVPNEETIGRSLEMAGAILADPNARRYVQELGYHAYPLGAVYTSPRQILESSGEGSPDPATRSQLEQLKALGQQYGVRIWMTEVTEVLGQNDFAFDAIENVLARAIHIHDVFEYAGASAFFGMNTLWDSRSHAEHFAGRNVPFLSEQSSMVLVDLDAGGVMITGMGYAVGHYARWVRPGAVRVEAGSSRARVIATAFRQAGRLVVVVVNNEPEAQLLRIGLAGGEASGEAIGETSHGSVRWEAVDPLAPAADGAFETAAPARSVVTLAIPIE